MSWALYSSETLQKSLRKQGTIPMVLAVPFGNFQMQNTQNY